jgi:hypothetical protein
MDVMTVAQSKAQWLQKAVARAMFGIVTNVR